MKSSQYPNDYEKIAPSLIEYLALLVLGYGTPNIFKKPYSPKENIIMENTRTTAIQMPEEPYQRMKSYLKRHQVKQKDIVNRLVEVAMEKEGGNK